LSRDLGSLFAPASVAVVGASADRRKWGHLLARGALRSEHRRRVYLVNRGGGEILGRRAHRSAAELPEPPELVVVAVPAAAFEDAVADSLAAGARAIVAISAGLGESGESGLARERAVAERVRAAGAALLGPNCLGVFDAASGLHLAWSEFPAGSIGLITQSGNLALELALLVGDLGLGFSRVASLGNQADLDARDLLEDFARHEPTRLIALYVEDFRDGRAFARAARAAGKPVVLLAAGESETSARAARTHTGALVSDCVAVGAACRAAGIVRVSTPKELVDAAQALLAGGTVSGRRVAVIGDGGGHGIVAADTLARSGLELPELSTELADRLARELPATATTTNPVDFAGGGERDVTCFERVSRLLLESGEVDAVLLTGYFGGYSEEEHESGGLELETAFGMARASSETGRPLVAHTMYPRGVVAGVLRERGVPVYREIEAAVQALAWMAELGPGDGVPELPDPAPAGPWTEDYWGARSLVAEAGVPLVEARRVSGANEAVVAAAEVGYPVVLKALDRQHKSDAGGVVLGLADEPSLVAACGRLEGRGELSLEHMAGGGVELIVGVRRDVSFGPVLLVGIGGAYAELLRDVAVALAPVDEAGAEHLLRSLRGSPLLTGTRGRPVLDVAGAAAAAVSLSRFAAARPAIAEIEINPLLVTADGVLALDARVVGSPTG
jgi:acyl-CoA synthetase (NDP forming)